MSVIDDKGNVQVIARQRAPCIRPLASPPKSSAPENAADATWCASIRTRPNANASIVPTSADRTRGGAFEPARVLAYRTQQAGVRTARQWPLWTVYPISPEPGAGAALAGIAPRSA